LNRIIEVASVDIMIANFMGGSVFITKLDVLPFLQMGMKAGHLRVAVMK
jgi:hypothetical protein